MDTAAGLPGLPAPPPLGASALPAGTFDGSLVLVTGGGTGLGRAVAAEFARLGADLLIVSRRERHLAPARRELARLGTHVASAVCDVRDPRRIAEVFDAHALPDVLVNNAAANFPVPTEDMSPNAWQSVVDITLTGTFLMTREFGRRHLAAGTPGSVIDVGASYAWTGGPGFAHSAAAKAGVESLVRTLAVEWGPYGIQVNGLVPGLMPHADMTDEIRGNLARAAEAAGHAVERGAAETSEPKGPKRPKRPKQPGQPEEQERPERPGDLEAPAGHGRRQPALRVGAPRELGWAATFLASPYARFITGHTLVVDGANWQRRGLVSPPVTPVREQLGRGPFTG